MTGIGRILLLALVSTAVAALACRDSDDPRCVSHYA